MQTQLEHRLSQLKTPDAPADLKARCLATVPVSARSAQMPVRRPLKFQFAVLGAFVVAVAFWNTRPGDNKTTASSGSVAFAQTMEAFKKVSFGHVWGRDMEVGILQRGWHASDFFQSEMWFDANRGLSWTRRANPSNSQPSLARQTSQQKLLLPDGTAYYRYDDSNRVLVTRSQKHWQSYKKALTDLLAGKWGTLSHSPSWGQWKGKRTQIFQGEATPSRADRKTMPGVTRLRSVLYVSPTTNLPLAFQDFAIYGDGIPRLTTEYEFDFSRPDAGRFDPAPLKKGAVVSHGREVG